MKTTFNDAIFGLIYLSWFYGCYSSPVNRAELSGKNLVLLGLSNVFPGGEGNAL
jgi:hypothetical protein